MINLFSPKEVSNILKISYRKVLDLISSGKLKAVQVDGMYRITEPDLIQFLEKNKVSRKW